MTKFRMEHRPTDQIPKLAHNLYCSKGCGRIIVASDEPIPADVKLVIGLFGGTPCSKCKDPGEYWKELQQGKS